jgi:hypothetical protein
MNVLVHTCCAPCLLAVLEPLRDAGHALRGVFYNPNIQPLIEFRRRLKALKVLNESLRLPIDYDETYDLDAFLGAAVNTGARRCEVCYRDRLTRTARHARDVGCDAFTTTMLSSTHQDHNLLCRVGRELAEREGVPFVDVDWREHSEPAHREAKRRQLYLQQYCGCVYSEYERFKDTARHVYRGGVEDADR